jgi:hypothetical protein
MQTDSQTTISGRDRQALYDAISNKRPFSTYGALRGVDYYSGTTGRLPNEYAIVYRQEPYPDYTVYSYGTPIAWHSEGLGWVIPFTRYSVTTSKHQGLARVALHISGLSYTE